MRSGSTKYHHHYHHSLHLRCLHQMYYDIILSAFLNFSFSLSLSLLVLMSRLESKCARANDIYVQGILGGEFLESVISAKSV